MILSTNTSKWVALPLAIALHLPAFYFYDRVLKHPTPLQPAYDETLPLYLIAFPPSEYTQAEPSATSGTTASQSATLKRHPASARVVPPQATQVALSQPPALIDKTTSAAAPSATNLTGVSIAQSAINDILQFDRNDARSNAAADKAVGQLEKRPLYGLKQETSLGLAIQKSARVDCLASAKDGEIKMSHGQRPTFVISAGSFCMRLHTA
jgi:hypothetical protein